MARQTRMGSVAAGEDVKGLGPASHSRHLASSGIRGSWGAAYLLLAVVLVPLVALAGPVQTAPIDVVNVLAIGMFAVSIVVMRRRIRVPLASAALLIALGSVLATLNAESVAQSAFTLAQDAYLFLWFVMLVNLMDREEDSTRIRRAWMYVAAAVAGVGVILLVMRSPSALQQVLSARGPRAAGTFLNPNMFADYLVLSLFVILSLSGSPGRLGRAACALLVLFQLVATKSNGGLIMLIAGLAAWQMTRTLTRRRTSVGLAGFAFVLLGVTVLALGTIASSGLLNWNSLREVQRQSILARVSHSSETRVEIWTELRDRYLQYPLGLGPGNSRLQRLTIADRQRRESYFSKEAHSDYVGYLTERGPLGLAGLLLMTGLAFAAILRALRASPTEVWRSGQGGAIAAALVGGLVATSVHSFMIEKLHFRHFWMFLALVSAFRPPQAAAAVSERRGL